ncbi:hypothetical protein FHQ26_05105 [Testudinibacter sp. TR-2022]|uniref:hypothetical protein n=1 Tax=Testudinibacter sp. TR-2022 TaxID=2585029 RepID=UPI001118E205|nr:hypothetical protein [Testudinibacter sp. TR-2022]TNH05215.1 hypothetical protein FHQ22_01930 [Pasteurellaceae bacterium Phil31]TNH08456.1 hypothetical protein FHQ25_09490 [Testudinibacter sp. TR-2022]TNH10524.1 hypothetical protein FHQ26_05105 [Testudinibacter sp. TR-2022]TNH11273.1 hypothetical protein FIA56_11475 [Testudinibacter sp. TR-2022]TNH15437.1 hypothetical protein FHQ23_10095 [Testudinibacter sp. TR-2022]
MKAKVEEVKLSGTRLKESVELLSRKIIYLTKIDKICVAEVYVDLLNFASVNSIELERNLFQIKNQTGYIHRSVVKPFGYTI